MYSFIFSNSYILLSLKMDLVGQIHRKNDHVFTTAVLEETMSNSDVTLKN